MLSRLQRILGTNIQVHYLVLACTISLIQKDLYSFGKHYKHFRVPLLTCYADCSYSMLWILQTLEQGTAYTWLVNCSTERDYHSP